MALIMFTFMFIHTTHSCSFILHIHTTHSCSFILHKSNTISIHLQYLSYFWPCIIIYRYEKEGKGRKTIKAQQLWYAIIEAQTETGTPYMLYKDHCNRKSNQQNLGTIKCSNLCTEIVEYSSADEVSLGRWQILTQTRNCMLKNMLQ